jgi:hypothetical protein
MTCMSILAVTCVFPATLIMWVRGQEVRIELAATKSMLKWPARWEDAKPIVESLADRATDPDVVESLLRLVEEMRWKTSKSWALWGPVLELLGRSRSADALARLETIRRRGTAFKYKNWIDSGLDKAIGELRHAGVVPAAPPAEAAIAASSDARQVDADALIDRGDPRGELIALQSARAEGRATRASIARERALLDEHEQRWLGQLAPAVLRGGTVWERGVLVECWLAGVNGAVRTAIGAPALATVQRLGFAFSVRNEPIAELLAHPVLRDLREIRRLPGWGIDRQLAALKQPLTASVVTASYWNDQALDELARVAPALRELGTYFPASDLDSLPDRPLWHTITTLASFDGKIAAWMDVLGKRPSGSLRKLRVFSEKERRALPDRGSLVYDVETRAIDLVVDRWPRLDEIAAPNGLVKLVRVRWLGKRAEALITAATRKLGARLEEVQIR